MTAFLLALLRFFRDSRVILSVVVLAGVLLRLFRLDHQSLWYDEALTLRASRLPFAEMTARVIEDFAHPPLHHYVLHAWFGLVGFGSFEARLLSVIFGCLAVVGIYLLANYLFEQQTALLAAILLSVSQIGVFYSQEARPYTQLLLIVLCLAYLLVIALRDNHAYAWWGFVCLSVALVYTHYHGVLVVASLLLYAFLYRRRYSIPRAWWVGGAVLGFVLFAPWLLGGMMRQTQIWGQTLLGGQPHYFNVHWWTFLSTLNRFNNGKPLGFFAATPWWVFLAGGLLFTVPALLALKALFTRRRSSPLGRSYRENVVLVAVLWLVPVLLALALGIINVQYDLRYVSFCAAPYYILVARGLTSLGSVRLRQILVVAIIVYSAYSLRANYFIPYKENYRDSLGHMAREYKEGDCSVFLPEWGVPLQWDIYYGNEPELQVETLDSVISSSSQCDRVWLISYRRTTEAAGQSDAGKRRLEFTHATVEEKHYFWVDLGLYVPNKK